MKPPLPPVLEVARLRIAREGKVILKGVDWTVRAGEHWVLLGPNGSGKSSLLAALTGYFAPTDGRVSVLGETFGRSDPARERPLEVRPADVVAAGPYVFADLWFRPV